MSKKGGEARAQLTQSPVDKQTSRQNRKER